MGTQTRSNRSPQRRKPRAATPVSATSVADRRIRRKFDPRATKKLPFGPGPSPWWKSLGPWYEPGRLSRARAGDMIEEAAAALSEFLTNCPTYVPMAWVAHITKVSRASIHKAVARREVKAIRHVLPSGHEIVLVEFAAALKVGRYKNCGLNKWTAA